MGASSRQDVRNTLATWLTNGTITNLNKVWTSFPKRMDFQLNATAGQLTRCQAVVFISEERESRIAVGGAYSGWKRVDYTIVLQLFCHSMQRNAEDAMVDFDILVDAVKARLRADHRFGDANGTLVWQGAEPEISGHYGEPQTVEGQAVETFAELEFQVTQMIQA